MDSFLQDLRYALRSARQKPGFTLAALLTLALGIGATTAIFSVVQAVLLRPLPYSGAESIVVFGQATPRSAENQIGSISVANFTDFRDQSTSFSAMALWSRANITVTGLGDAESIPGTQVTEDFFRVFAADPFMGRTFTAEETRPDGPQAIIVSHEFWQERLGGDPAVLQRTLEVSGVPRPIVGVTPAGFGYPTGARLYIPVRNSEGCGRGCVYLVGVGRLAPGKTVAAARTELVGIAQRLEQQYPESNTDVTARVRSLTDFVVGDVRRALYVLLGAVVMVLLIACANVANLLLVRGATRSAEMAVRSALGAGRRRLLMQLMTENALLAVLGGGLGIVLSSWGVDLLRGFAPAELPRVEEISLNGGAFAFAAVLVLLTAVLFGAVPAWRSASHDLASTLRSSGRGDLGISQGWARFGILVTEVALAVMLLLGAGLMMRSLAHMNDVDPGFRTDDIALFTIGLPGSRYESPEKGVLFYEELKQRLAALPGVEQVGLVLPVPLGPSVYATSMQRTDRPAEPGREPIALLRTIDGNGFDVLDVSLSAGRGFQPTDRHGSEPVALINRTAAERFWPGEDPVGKQVEVSVTLGFDEQPRTIVGVIEDLRPISLTEAPEPEVLLPYAQVGSSSATLLLRTADPAQVLTAARAEVRAMDARLPLIRPGTMDDLLGAQTAHTRFYLLLLGIFAGLALSLAAVGIYGVVAFVVARRSREIGVRLALGARIQEVVGLVVWQGVRPALVGLAVGGAGALAASRVIGGLLFDVKPHDPLTFLGVTVLLLGIVVIACMVPAGRASRIPPASALRSE